MNRPIAVLFISTSLIYGYFVLSTPSRYKSCPLGDARTFTLMAMNFDSPGRIEKPLPRLYVSRMLPSLIVGFFSQAALRGLENVKSQDSLAAQLCAPADDTQRSVLKAYKIVWHGFLLLNFISALATVLFLYLMFKSIGIQGILRLGLPLTFLSFFISARLYVRWPQMADPLGFALLTGMFYFLLSNRMASFLILAPLGALTRENTLFLLPCYWIQVWQGQEKPGRKALLLALSSVPVLLFLYLRAHPYFPAMSTAPIPQYQEVLARLPNHANPFFEYISILEYHLYMATTRHMWGNIMLMPFYVFGVFSYVLLAKWKNTLKCLAHYKFLLPFILMAAFTGLWADRHAFYLFPVVLIASAHILQDALPDERKKLFSLVGIFFAHIILYEHWRFVPKGMTGFATNLQLEYAFNASHFIPIFVRTLFSGVATMLVCRVLRLETRW